MSQRQQLERVLEIDRQIRANLYPNAEKLAAQFEVSRRVLFLDREFLINRLGAPIAYDRERDGWYYTEPTWLLPTAMVTEGELLAFFLSIEIAKRYIGTNMEEPLVSAVEKIMRGMKGPVSVDLQSLQTAYTFAGPAVPTVNKDTLVRLHRAISGGRKIRMEYFSANRGKKTDRVVFPYHLYNIRGDWYVVGYDSLRKAVRNFHVARIEKLELLQEKFDPDLSFSPKKWMATALAAERGGPVSNVAIRFDAYQARWIRERVFHESQRIEERHNGGLILHLRCAVTGELQRWILQFGSHARVLKPAGLVNSLKKAFTRALSGLNGEKLEGRGKRVAKE